MREPNTWPRSSWLAAVGLGLLAGRLPAQAEAPPEVAAGAAADESVAAPESPAMLLHLGGGDVLWGFVEQHDPDALTVLRLDNGGRVRLPWGRVDTTQREELRERWGYVEHAAEELLVTADLLPLADGTELIGVIVNRSEDHLYVKTARTLLTVPKLQIAGVPSRVQVPALDIYSREELYQSKLEELQGRESLRAAGRADSAAPGAATAAGLPRALKTPEANWELAEYCVRILDFAHAHEHFLAVSALDPVYRAEQLQPLLQVASRKASAQVQVDQLAEIDFMRARKRYDDALAACAAFPARFPDSPLREDLGKLVARIERSQERDLRAEVVRSFRATAPRVARAAVRDKGFAEALAYADSDMHKDVLAAVTAEVAKLARKVQPGDVQRLWDEREPGRYLRGTYGEGTWLLGEERALAGLEDEAEAPAAQDSRDPERRKREEQVRRYLENQKVALESRKQAGEGEDPEEFWRELSSSSRALWLLAYYVEQSGQFEIRDVRFQNCRECSGTGVRQVLFLTANPGDNGQSTRLYACPTCHHIGKVRRISYR